MTQRRCRHFRPAADREFLLHRILDLMIAQNRAAEAAIGVAVPWKRVAALGGVKGARPPLCPVAWRGGKQENKRLGAGKGNAMMSKQREDKRLAIRSSTASHDFTQSDMRKCGRIEQYALPWQAPGAACGCICYRHVIVGASRAPCPALPLLIARWQALRCADRFRAQRQAF